MAIMEETYAQLAPEENILDDVQYNLVQASTGKRFLNFLIDRIAIYLVWNYLLYKLEVAVLTVIYEYTHSRELLYVFSYLLTITFFVFILAILESVTGGKTLGKLITGTRAVNQAFGDRGAQCQPQDVHRNGACRLGKCESVERRSKPPCESFTATQDSGSAAKHKALL